MLEIATVEVTPIQQNARVIFCSVTKECVVVDPGGDVNLILQEVDQRAGKLVGIWLTHSHFDHCGGVAELKRQRPVGLWAHPEEKLFRGRVEQICMMYGMPNTDMKNCPEPEHAISGGEILHVGNLSFAVLFTPGHAPGHLCFLHRESGTLIAGDTLFAGSIGRTDLPGGDHKLLLQSIASQILTLPDETKVLPGHGPNTTVGIERRSNPFLN